MSSDDNKNNNYQTELLLRQILEKVNSDDVKDGLDRFSDEVKGEFGEIKSELSDVKISLVKVDGEIDKLKTSGDSREKTLNEVHKAIFDPFTGIYSKLSGNDTKFKNISEKLKSLEQQISNTKTDLIKEIEISENDFELKIYETNKRQDITEGKIKLLTDIGGGETFPDTKSTIDAHKNFNKLWWALILAVISGFGKVVWDVIKELN